MGPFIFQESTPSIPEVVFRFPEVSAMGPGWEGNFPVPSKSPSIADHYFTVQMHHDSVIIVSEIFGAINAGAYKASGDALGRTH